METGSGEGISTFFLFPVFDTTGGNGKRLGSEHGNLGQGLDGRRRSLPRAHHPFDRANLIIDSSGLLLHDLQREFGCFREEEEKRADFTLCGRSPMPYNPSIFKLLMLYLIYSLKSI
jgi:hypothetical protein